MDNKTQERIKADAEKCDNILKSTDYRIGFKYGYIAGATAEHEKTEAAIDAAIHKERNALQAKVTQMDIDWLKRSQVLVDALEEISESNCDYESTSTAGKLHKPDCKACRAKEALEQWKGKEVGDELP